MPLAKGAFYSPGTPFIIDRKEYKISLSRILQLQRRDKTALACHNSLH